MAIIYRKNKNGFTLIETLITIAIGIIIFSLVLFSFSSFKNNDSLQKNVAQVKAVLEEVQSLSISGKNNYFYGIHIQSNGIIEFKLPTATSTYNPSDSQNTPDFFDSNTSSIDNISLNNGGSDIVFQKITGTTNNYGTFRIKMIGDSSKYSTIRVTGSGLISEE